MRHGYQLKTDVDFHNAILFKCLVSITKDGEDVGSGYLLSQSHHAVETVDSYYFKNTCEFTVVTMVH
jgi:hypothetical protein